MDDSPPRAQHAHGEAPLILFGAFDRHNFGDMLFASVAQAMLGARPVVCAGLAERDLTPWGGPRTVAISRLAATWHERYGDAPTHVIHVGGEILTCDSYEAAVMLHDARGARQAIAHYDAAPMERRRWAARYLGMERQAPYVLPRAALSRPGLLVFHAVGGVDLERREAPLRAEVLVSLRGADSVTVRDQRTREILAAAGVRAALAPDGAVLVAQLFASRVQRHAGAGEPARVRAAFPGGYIAVQFSADFGDDDTLSLIACQLDTASRETGWGVVFFRAGAAPWHDDLECYARAVARMTSHTHVFRSLDIWDIAALISHAQLYCGSSLHGRIAALAFERPRVSVVRSAPLPGKQRAFIATWEQPPGVWAEVDAIGQAARVALAEPQQVRAAIMRHLVECARQSYADWMRLLPPRG